MGRLLYMNPLVPTPMDVVATLVGLALTVMVLSVLVALVMRVVRRARTSPSASESEPGA